MADLKWLFKIIKDFRILMIIMILVFRKFESGAAEYAFQPQVL